MPGTSTGLENDVVIAGVRYVVARNVSRDRPGLAWWRGDGEVVTAEWDDWSGGMGETQRVAPDSNGYAYTVNWDCNLKGLARLAPAKYAVQGTTISIAANIASTFFQEVHATGGTIFYYFGQQNILYKIQDVDGTSTGTVIVQRRNMGANALIGTAARFEGKWYIPLGASVLFVELTTIAPPLTRQFYNNGTTFTDNTSAARQVGGTAFTLLSGASDFAYWGVTTYTFTRLGFDIVTAGDGATVSWQYWNGAAWTALTVTDGTTNFTVDGEVSWTAPVDWASTTVNGVAAFYVRAVPSGVFGTAPTAAWASTADTYTNADAGSFALDFAVVQDGATARLARAYSTNLVAMAATAPLTSGSWGSGFEVGDTTQAITGMASTATGQVVAKADNLWIFSPVGAAYEVFPFKPGTGYSGNGIALTTLPGQDVAIYNHTSGLWAMVGEAVRPIGPDTLPTLLEIPNLTGEPFRGSHYQVSFYGWLYSSYETNDSQRTFILAGKIIPGFTFLWHTLLAYSTEDVAGIYINQTAFLAGATFFVATGSEIRRYVLGPDGSPDASSFFNAGRGTASTTHQLFLPEVPFYRGNGEPVWDRLKTLRACKVLARGLDTTSPLQVQVMRDGGAIENIGATITAAGYSERAPTVGTNDTARLARYVLDITTTAAYAPASSDPQVLRFEAQAVLQEVHFIIDCTATVEAGRVSDYKTIRDNLENLRGGAGQTVTDPDGESLTMTITRVSDLQSVPDEMGNVAWLLDVVAEVN